jgi:putative FmdB family regulatory protein
VPTYEYITEDQDNSCEYCHDVFEEIQSIKDDALTVCPECSSPIRKLVSLIHGCVIKGKEPNQYNDCVGARTWRDKNGNLHKVTPGDGHSKAGTVSSHKYRSDEQVAAIKARDAKIRQEKRKADSYRKYKNRMKQANKTKKPLL